jgi:hypothetical protein
MLVGHYEMLAMTLNSLGVPVDSLRSEWPPRAVRMARAVASRLSRSGQ